MGELTCKASDGSISPISYTAPEISGEEKITATLAETGEKASKSIFAMVPAIEPLASNGNIYELVSSDHHGFENHYGVPDLVSKVISLAMTYQSHFQQREGIAYRLRIGNMSLPWGGLFDIFGNWTTPHKSHRIGNNVDISHHVLDGDGNLVYLGTRQDRLDTIASQIGLKRRVEDSAEECPALQSGEPPCIHYSLE